MGSTENTAAHMKFPRHSGADRNPAPQSEYPTPHTRRDDGPRKRLPRTQELIRPAGLPQKPSFNIADQGFTPRSNSPRITRIQDVATSVTPSPPITSPVMPVDEASSTENDWLRERQDARARRQANKKAAFARDRAEQQARREKLQAARMRRQADAAAKQKQQQTAIIAKKLTEAIYERLNAAAKLPSPPTKRERQVEGVLLPLPLGEGRGEGLNSHNQPPPLSDEAIQSNQRLAESLKKRAGVGDLPKFTSDAINTDGPKAIPEIVALIREVETSDPKQARELYQQTLQGITPENQRLLESAYESEVAAHQSVDTETHLKIENQSSDTTNTSAQKTQSGTLLARLEEMDAIYNESGFEGLVDTYGPEIRDALSDLASYVNDPENAENVSSIAFETVLGVDPTDPNLKDAGLTAILGAMASKRARQIKVGAKLAKQLAQETGRGSEKSTMASKGVNMYNGPTIDRPFKKDYPNGYQADKAGNLTHDIEGRPLVPGGKTVGRRMVDGSEKTLVPQELNAIAETATGHRPSIQPTHDMGGAVGSVVVDALTTKPKEVRLSKNLTSEQLPKVLGHEVGHVIDQYAGEIPTQGIKKELNDLYDILNNPNRNQSDPNMSANWGKRFTPKALGYKDADVDRELMAEAIRVYMVNPSYIKERAPNTAAKIRKWVNEHPELRKIVQFNSVAGATVIGAESSSEDDE